MRYELYYWPEIQGRGEFIRLALEEAGADYVDVARREGKGGVAAMMKFIDDKSSARPPFAPPYLKVGKLVIAQTANILMYLGPKLGLAPGEENLLFFAQGLQLTITDFVAEVHDTHHPIATDLFYEEQVEEAKARTKSFIKHRMPKFFGYFERILNDNPDGGGYAVGARLSCVDLSLFQVIEGLHYAFPRALKPFRTKYPSLAALRETIAERPNIARYLASERRIPFNESGIFRRYPELDVAAR